MNDTVPWLVLALVATGCALYTLRTAVPLRRFPEEGWVSLYFRTYWNPGTAVVIALYAWSVVLGVRIFDEDPSLAIFLAAVGMLALVTATAAADRLDFWNRRSGSSNEGAQKRKP